MAYCRIIMPVLNRHFLPFEEPVWNLADKVSCRTIPDIDYGAVWRYLDDKMCNIDRGLTLKPNVYTFINLRYQAN
jgi:hypothetical protein